MCFHTRRTCSHSCLRALLNQCRCVVSVGACVSVTHCILSGGSRVVLLEPRAWSGRESCDLYCNARQVFTSSGPVFVQVYMKQTEEIMLVQVHMHIP
jgi:hypothetical protein